MATVGYGLFSEEHAAADLVTLASKAEQAGFGFATLSDHYHPWLESQGESPFAWGVLGAIATATSNLVLGTTVTCPIGRIHPAIIAQAAATTATLAPGRFFLGVGSGESLNEHILGDPWPRAAIRLKQLDEAIAIMRRLWSGRLTSFDGEYFTVDRAKLYSLPAQPPALMVAASGKVSARLAAESGDGLITGGFAPEVLKLYREAGGRGPVLGSLSLCWAETAERGMEVLREHWPNAALQGTLGQDLDLPSDFEAAVAHVRAEDLEAVPCGPDPEPIRDLLAKYDEAGYDFVYLHQVGPYQDGFFTFFERELAPGFATDAMALDRLVSGRASVGAEASGGR
jgi:G6PDH family F420-dependent oxidoreductase